VSEQILNGTSAQIGYTLQCHSRQHMLENTDRRKIKNRHYYN